MHRTSNTFSVLQAIAAIASLAVILWSLGLPSFQFVEAANVTTYSDTLSTSEPSVAANHTIEFTTPTGVANGETIVLDFSDGPFVLGSVDDTDVDIATTSDYTIGAACGAVDVSAVFTAGPTLTLTMCVAGGKSIPANGTTTIKIGTNATYSGDTGDANAQMTNPAVGSYQIPITAGSADSGETRVAIVSTVQVTATVDTSFTFTVTGVQGNQTVNGTTTGATTTATLIPFGVLQANVASTAAQDLTVVTNAKNGFTITVTADQQLSSVTGADIDGFIDGAYTSTGAPWQSPANTLGSENTYGHWGITSDDSSVNGDHFDTGGDGQDYVSASTSPVEVFNHNGPTDGTTTGQGTTRVGYTVEVGSLQEAATDYQATLTYVATPVF